MWREKIPVFFKAMSASSWIIGVLVVLYGAVGHATTSCGPAFQFLGFSVDGERAYWEKETGGECVPVLAVYEKALGTLRSERRLGWPSKFVSRTERELNLWIGPIWGSPHLLFWTYSEAGQDYEPPDAESPDHSTWKAPAQYRRDRTRLVQGLNLPRPLTLWGLDKKDQVEQVALTKLDEAVLLVTTPARACAIRLPVFEDWEHYLYDSGKIKTAYYQPQQQFWVVITSHCNIGNTDHEYEKKYGDCARDDALAIYDMKECR